MPATKTVPDELGFRFHHGPIAHSLEEFAAILAQSPAASVFYHRAHFAPWLRDVMHDAALARRLEGYAQGSMAPDVYREIVVDLVARRAASR